MSSAASSPMIAIITWYGMHVSTHAKRICRHQGSPAVISDHQGYPRKEDLRRRGQGMLRRSEHLHASSSSRSTQGCLRSECMQVLSTAGAHREAVSVCDPSALKPSARRSPLGEEHARHGEIPHQKRP